jgi:hypothetical protein
VSRDTKLHVAGEPCEHEELQAKVSRLCLLQHRTESDLWRAIDKIADYCQAHELILTKLRKRQWAILVMTGASVLLGLANLLGH